jgi:hypothetical protein
MESKITAVPPITVPEIDFTKLTPEQLQGLIAQQAALNKAIAQATKATNDANRNTIDALRYEIFDARESMKECTACAAHRAAAAKAHEELKAVVLTGADKVKFSEDETATFTARRNRERSSKAAAKNAK